MGHVAWFSEQLAVNDDALRASATRTAPTSTPRALVLTVSSGRAAVDDLFGLDVGLVILFGVGGVATGTAGWQIRRSHRLPTQVKAGTPLLGRIARPITFEDGRYLYVDDSTAHFSDGRTAHETVSVGADGCAAAAPEGDRFWTAAVHPLAGDAWLACSVRQ